MTFTFNYQVITKLSGYGKTSAIATLLNVSYFRPNSIPITSPQHLQSLNDTTYVSYVRMPS